LWEVTDSRQLSISEKYLVIIIFLLTAKGTLRTIRVSLIVTGSMGFIHESKDTAEISWDKSLSTFFHICLSSSKTKAPFNSKLHIKTRFQQKGESPSARYFVAKTYTLIITDFISFFNSKIFKKIVKKFTKTRKTQNIGFLCEVSYNIYGFSHK